MNEGGVLYHGTKGIRLFSRFRNLHDNARERSNRFLKTEKSGQVLRSSMVFWHCKKFLWRKKEL